jgi:hypothetical protein
MPRRRPSVLEVIRVISRPSRGPRGSFPGPLELWLTGEHDGDIAARRVLLTEMSNLLAKIVAALPQITDTIVAGAIGKDENTAFEIPQTRSERVVSERGSSQSRCLSAIAAQVQRFRTMCIANGVDKIAGARGSPRLAAACRTLCWTCAVCIPPRIGAPGALHGRAPGMS